MQTIFWQKMIVPLIAIHLNPQQKTIIWSTTAAVVFSTAFLLIAYFFIPLPLPLLDTPEQRLIFSLRCQIFPALMLLLGIIAVSKGRFSSNAVNPLAGAESPSMQVNQRYLSNTLEQLVLFFVASLILSTFLGAESIKLIPILATLFVFSRIAFWLGYLQHPMNRGFGMAATLYPIALMLLYDGYRILGG